VVYRKLGTWAAWYNTWLLVTLTPKGIVFSISAESQGAWGEGRGI